EREGADRQCAVPCSGGRRASDLRVRTLGAQGVHLCSCRGRARVCAMRRELYAAAVRYRDDPIEGVPMNARIHKLARSAAGFTLLEHAVSLSIIALVLGSVLVPLQTQLENRKLDETRRMLDVAAEMLLGYAAANGYFP